MIVVLMLMLLQDGAHTVPMSALATTRWTHVCVTGPVVYVRTQRDHDIHVTLDDGVTKIVLEIIAALPLPRPKKGTVIRACGISRFDRYHGWPEIHPVTHWTLIKDR